jgi:hypothetical protein
MLLENCLMTAVKVNSHRVSTKDGVVYRGNQRIKMQKLKTA